jgi:hypothetical protein
MLAVLDSRWVNSLLKNASCRRAWSLVRSLRRANCVESENSIPFSLLDLEPSATEPSFSGPLVSGSGFKTTWLRRAASRSDGGVASSPQNLVMPLGNRSSSSAFVARSRHLACCWTTSSCPRDARAQSCETPAHG